MLQGSALQRIERYGEFGLKSSSTNSFVAESLKDDAQLNVFTLTNTQGWRDAAKAIEGSSTDEDKVRSANLLGSHRSSFVPEAAVSALGYALAISGGELELYCCSTPTPEFVKSQTGDGNTNKKKDSKNAKKMAAASQQQHQRSQVTSEGVVEKVDHLLPALASFLKSLQRKSVDCTPQLCEAFALIASSSLDLLSLLLASLQAEILAKKRAAAEANTEDSPITSINDTLEHTLYSLANGRVLDKIPGEKKSVRTGTLRKLIAKTLQITVCCVRQWSWVYPHCPNPKHFAPVTPVKSLVYPKSQSTLFQKLSLMTFIASSLLEAKKEEGEASSTPRTLSGTLLVNQDEEDEGSEWSIKGNLRGFQQAVTHFMSRVMVPMSTKAVPYVYHRADEDRLAQMKISGSDTDVRLVASLMERLTLKDATATGTHIPKHLMQSDPKPGLATPFIRAAAFSVLSWLTSHEIVLSAFGSGEEWHKYSKEQRRVIVMKEQTKYQAAHGTGAVQQRAMKREAKLAMREKSLMRAKRQREVEMEGENARKALNGGAEGDDDLDDAASMASGLSKAASSRHSHAASTATGKSFGGKSSTASAVSLMSSMSTWTKNSMATRSIASTTLLPLLDHEKDVREQHESMDGNTHLPLILLQHCVGAIHDSILQEGVLNSYGVEFTPFEISLLVSTAVNITGRLFRVIETLLEWNDRQALLNPTLSSRIPRFFSVSDDLHFNRGLGVGCLAGLHTAYVLNVLGNEAILNDVSEGSAYVDVVRCQTLASCLEVCDTLMPSVVQQDIPHILTSILTSTSSGGNTPIGSSSESSASIRYITRMIQQHGMNNQLGDLGRIIVDVLALKNITQVNALPAPAPLAEQEGGDDAASAGVSSSLGAEPADDEGLPGEEVQEVQKAVITPYVAKRAQANLVQSLVHAENQPLRAALRKASAVVIDTDSLINAIRRVLNMLLGTSSASLDEEDQENDAAPLKESEDELSDECRRNDVLSALVAVAVELLEGIQPNHVNGHGILMEIAELDVMAGMALERFVSQDETFCSTNADGNEDEENRRTTLGSLLLQLLTAISSLSRKCLLDTGSQNFYQLVEGLEDSWWRFGEVGYQCLVAGCAPAEDDSTPPTVYDMTLLHSLGGSNIPAVKLGLHRLSLGHQVRTLLGKDSSEQKKTFDKLAKSLIKALLTLDDDTTETKNLRDSLSLEEWRLLFNCKSSVFCQFLLAFLEGHGHETKLCKTLLEAIPQLLVNILRDEQTQPSLKIHCSWLSLNYHGPQALVDDGEGIQALRCLQEAILSSWVSASAPSESLICEISSLLALVGSNLFSSPVLRLTAALEETDEAVTPNEIQWISWCKKLIKLVTIPGGTEDRTRFISASLSSLVIKSSAPSKKSFSNRILSAAVKQLLRQVGQLESDDVYTREALYELLASCLKEIAPKDINVKSKKKEAVSGAAIVAEEEANTELGSQMVKLFSTLLEDFSRFSGSNTALYRNLTKAIIRLWKLCDSFSSSSVASEVNALLNGVGKAVSSSFPVDFIVGIIKTREGQVVEPISPSGPGSAVLLCEVCPELYQASPQLVSTTLLACCKTSTSSSPSSSITPAVVKAVSTLYASPSFFAKGSEWPSVVHAILTAASNLAANSVVNVPEHELENRLQVILSVIPLVKAPLLPLHRATIGTQLVLCQTTASLLATLAVGISSPLSTDQSTTTPLQELARKLYMEICQLLCTMAAIYPKLLVGKLHLLSSLFGTLTSGLAHGLRCNLLSTPSANALSSVLFHFSRRGVAAAQSLTTTAFFASSLLQAVYASAGALVDIVGKYSNAFEGITFDLLRIMARCDNQLKVHAADEQAKDDEDEAKREAWALEQLKERKIASATANVKKKKQIRALAAQAREQITELDDTSSYKTSVTKGPLKYEGTSFFELGYNALKHTHPNGRALFKKDALKVGEEQEENIGAAAFGAAYGLKSSY